MARTGALLVAVVVGALALRRVLQTERTGRGMAADIMAGELSRSLLVAAGVVVAGELAGIPSVVTLPVLLYWLWYAGLLQLALGELGLELEGGTGGAGGTTDDPGTIVWEYPPSDSGG